jgi:hypothetical protein
LSKAHRLPFLNSTTEALFPLQIIHCDGYRYYVLFTDQFSRFNWIYFCSHKSQVASIFSRFKALVENTLSAIIKIVQVDGGTEFLQILRSYPPIQFRVSCPYTPQQNGLAE